MKQFLRVLLGVVGHDYDFLEYRGHGLPCEKSQLFIKQNAYSLLVSVQWNRWNYSVLTAESDNGNNKYEKVAGQNTFSQETTWCIGQNPWRRTMAAAYTPHVYAIESITYEVAETQAYKNITDIVNAEIDTRVAVEQWPADDKRIGPLLSDQIAEQNSYAKGVGGMGREETVFATFVSVYGVKQVAVYRVLGWAPSLKERLENIWRELVADEYAQNKEQYDGQ